MRASTEYDLLETAASRSHWHPTLDTWIALCPCLAVVGGLAVAFQVFTIQHVAANFITYAITLAGLGVAFPVLYTVMVRQRPRAALW